MPLSHEELRRCAGVSKVQYNKWLKDRTDIPDPSGSDSSSVTAARIIGNMRPKTHESLRADVIGVSAAAKEPI